MKKPWHIWTLFGLALTVALVAMVWLSLQINRADQLREQDRIETELARRQAELQERINSALYRMDFWATPLVAQEAARPYYLYEPVFQVSGDATSVLPQQANMDLSSIQSKIQRTSPLVYETSEYVVMHFQVTDDNQITSPQACKETAMACGVSPDQIADNQKKVELASLYCQYEDVLVGCVELPPADADPESTKIGFASVYRDSSFNRFTNPYGISNDILLEQVANSVPQTKNVKSLQQEDRSQNRGKIEYTQRVQSVENSAQSQWATNNQSANANIVTPSADLVREGVMRPMWLGDKLLLARRVESEKKKLVQCCWLNWEKIRQQLKSEVQELLPDVEFQPVTSDNDLNFSRAMATLPIQLVVDTPKLLANLAIESPQPIDPNRSGLKLSLWLAWLGLAFGLFASALLLKGVIRLSERRAAFVSAVTHELRTPLTTFRMYSEMLAEKMVPEDKQQEYAETMKTEADRLSNLVENVLQFARLEQGPNQCASESLTLEELFSRFKSRLEKRAEELSKKLSVRFENSGQQQIKTEPGKVEQIVFNLVDNACKYSAKSKDDRVEVTVTLQNKRVLVSVRDFGPGVARKFRKLLFKPFCKSDQDSADTASGVGLGLALCQRMARSLGGKVYLEPSESGAKFVFEFPQQ